MRGKLSKIGHKDMTHHKIVVGLVFLFVFICFLLFAAVFSNKNIDVH